MRKNLRETQKLSYVMNTIILILVLVMMGIYYAIGATALVYYSIFVTAVYLLHYPFIRKYKLVWVTWSIYAMLTLYMFICTISLGYNYGFQLYAMSTIPLIYYIKYIAKKNRDIDPKPTLWAMLIITSCITSSLYAVKNGPVYQIDGTPALTFLALNLSSVCFFLTFFAKKTIQQILDTEDKMEWQANYDALTGLSNRYNMTARMKVALNTPQADRLWIAMLDVDDFKKINDQYGHATGDRVLVKLAENMRKICKDCIISRWGGEEFLISGKGEFRPLLEDLVKKTAISSVQSPYGDVHFTISVGVSPICPSDSLDSWIMKADKLLYKAKNKGKNQVYA